MSQYRELRPLSGARPRGAGRFGSTAGATCETGTARSGSDQLTPRPCSYALLCWLGTTELSAAVPDAMEGTGMLILPP